MAKLLTRSVRVLLAASLTSSALVVAGAAGSASASGGSVTGRVFRDLNADGVRQSAEVGVAGVAVSAYGESADALESTTTGPDGSYSLTVTDATVTDVRVEFELPQGSFLRPGVQLTNGATNVQFVPMNSIDVNWAVQNPSDYCGNINDTKLVTNCWKWGDQQSTRKALGTWEYDTHDGQVFPGQPPANLGADFHNLAFVSEAAANQIGTTYGLGYNRATATLFAGSFYRRFAGLHERRTGAVYSFTNPGTPNSQLAAEPWLDLDDLYGRDANGVGVSGIDLHPTEASGTTLTMSNPPTPAQLGWLHDSASWPVVAKTSLGDIEVTEDNKHLFIVNLHDRHLYRASANTRPTSSDDIARTPIVTAPNCNADDSRPFGLGFNDGVGYIGIVCSAESTFAAIPNTAALYAAVDAAEGNFGGRSPQAQAAWAAFRTAIKPALDQLRAYVFTFDPNTMPADASGFDLALDIDLTHTRTAASEQWLPWTDDFTMTIMKEQNVYEQRWHEPVLASIAFDSDKMFIGLRNRFGDRTSFHGGHPDPTYMEDYGNGPTPRPEYNQTYGARGAVLVACKPAGGWQLESDGRCGTDFGSMENFGPGGGQFYGRSSELSMGALVHATGAPEIVTTMMDPVTEFSNGTAKFFAEGIIPGTVGGPRVSDASFSIYYTPNVSNTETFGKSNGLGDLALLCDGAPVQIGNRAWLDANDNKRQDPTEPGVPNLKVDLISSNGTTVATTTTDADGNYLFTSLTTPELKMSNPNHVGLRLRVARTSYEAALPAGFGPIGTAAGASNLNDSDFTGFYTTEATTSPLPLDPGNPVHHNLDLGFGPGPDPIVPRFAISGSVWDDENANAIRDAIEADGTLIVELLDENDLVVAWSANTNAYRFQGLEAGTYTVRFRGLTALQLWSNCNVGGDPTIDSDACNRSGPVATTNPLTLDDTLPAVEPSDDAPQADHILRSIDAGYFTPGPRNGTT